VEFFAGWTEIDIPLCFIAKAIRTKKLGAVVNIRKRDISTNMLGFQGNNILFRAVLAVSGHLSRPEFPTEAGAPDQITHWLNFPSLQQA
jgi:hypothetical protein